MRRSSLAVLVIIAVALVIGLVVWRRAAAGGGQRGGASAPRPVAVELATAGRRDLPVWLQGIGVVQASGIVTVRPRVGGTLDQVAFAEGATVAAGDILAQIDPRPYRAALAQAAARKAQDEAQVANARRELDRIRALVAGEAESQRVLDQQEATLAQLTAQLAADQAALDAAQLDLDFTTVRSPIGGRTGARLIDAGNVVTPSQEQGLVVVTTLQPITVVFTLPQRHLPALLPHLAPGAAPTTVEALADDGTVLAAGTLALIDNQVDAATGGVRLKAAFANGDGRLWPGQFVSARVLVDTRRGVLTVPAEVIQAGPQGAFAYARVADGTAALRPLQVGPTIGGATIVEDGLADVDRVVRTGQNRLKPGAAMVEAGADKAAVRPAGAGPGKAAP